MREIAWVIELHGPSGTVLYWGRTVEGIGPTPENLDALRFCRREDAALAILSLPPYPLSPEVAEHVWDDMEPTPEFTGEEYEAGEFAYEARRKFIEAVGDSLSLPEFREQSLLQQNSWAHLAVEFKKRFVCVG